MCDAERLFEAIDSADQTKTIHDDAHLKLIRQVSKFAQAVAADEVAVELIGGEGDEVGALQQSAMANRNAMLATLDLAIAAAKSSYRARHQGNAAETQILGQLDTQD